MSTFRKPIAGEPANLILSQGFQSALVDVVNAFNRGELTKKPQELRKQSIVFVKNTSGATIQPGQALSVDTDAPAVGSSMLVSYLHNPLVYGSAVSWHGNIGQLAIASETIINDQSGPCQVNGWGRVKANPSGVGEWLMIDPAVPQQFMRATGGVARVITADATSGEVVADFRDQQPLWRYELLSDVNNKSATASLLDLNGAVYGTVTLRFLRNDEKIGDRGQCLHTGNYFNAIEDEQPTPRFRFRLKTSFDDTGQATAKVLDTFGTVRNPDGSIVALGDILTVNDPRKLFAHAIGYDDLAVVHAGASAFFPAGGSVGYAVETEQLKAEPADPDDPQYPRWEVEQCTQIIDKMIVQIQGGEPPTPGITGKPTGTNDEGAFALKFKPDTAILSRWPDVDYCPEWIPPATPEDDWQILVKNPNRFSAGNGWAIIERRETKSRAQDAENVDTPYSPNADGIMEWHVTEVENPIARWICAIYNGNSQGWAYQDICFEGEDPSTSGYFGGAVPISVAQCLQLDCLETGQIGVAFWDPNTQIYKVVSTNSSLYGTATQIEAIAQKVEGALDPLLDFDQCNLNWIKSKPIRVFGMHDPCVEEKTTETATPAFITVDVVTGSYREGNNICFTKSQVYVCSAVPIIDPDCVYVCCDDVIGCCVMTQYDGDTVYLPGVTDAVCQAKIGTGAGPDEVTSVVFNAGEDCPSVCIPCDGCTECGGSDLEFVLGAIKGEDSNGNVVQAIISTAVWTVPAGADNCCAELSVDFESNLNPGTFVNRTATVCLHTGTPTIPGCVGPPASFELHLNWDGGFVLGIDLPTALGNDVYAPSCVGGYGNSGCGILPIDSSPGMGWDEVVIHVSCCDTGGGIP